MRIQAVPRVGRAGRVATAGAVATLVATLVATGFAPVPQPGAVGAAGAAGGPCTGSDGVTVVVDASRLGGGVRTGCAAGSPRNGLEALRAAGFAVRGTARFPGFVCRIDDAPASDPCLDSAPADAYWAYWHGPPGGGWTYSDTGAADRRPPVGSVEGWVFSDETGAPPSVAPPARAAVVPPPVNAPVPVPGSVPTAEVAGRTAVAPSPAGPPPAVAPPTTGVATDAPGVASATPPSAAAPVPGLPTPPVGATDATNGGPPEAGPGSGSGDASGDETSLGAAAEASTPTQARDASDGAGSPWPTIVGAALVVAVAITGVTLARRRRAGSTAPW